MEKRERLIQRLFHMWLEGKDHGILDIFSKDAIYIESWGPEYKGADKIKIWFDEWNTRGKVLIWDIRQYFHESGQTVVEWYFKCSMNDGTVQSFDGVSIIRWSDDDKITYLKEFGCNIDNYDPYEHGGKPEFRNTAVMWF